MKVVVTGESGLIGRYVVEELLKFNYEVLNFDIIEPKEKKLDFVKGDMLNIDNCRRYFKGADVIVHLAVIPNPFNDPRSTRQDHVLQCNGHNEHICC